MFISILVPVYNVERYIRKCIDSILSQTYRNFEVILYDDGSTDLSGTICDEYKEKDLRIQVIHSKNKGAYITRISLLDYANGQYALYVDPDDWISPDALERISQIAETTDADIVHFNHFIVDDSGMVLCKNKEIYNDNHLFTENEIKNVYIDFIETDKLNYLWEKLIKVSILKSAKYIDVEDEKTKGNDVIQLLAVMKEVKSLIYVAEPLYYYRQSKSGMGRQFLLNEFENSRFIRKNQLNFIKENLDNSSKVLKKFFNKYRNFLVIQVMTAVHSERYTYYELKRAFVKERSSEIYLQALSSGKTVNGSFFHKLTFKLFINKWDELMIVLLSFENFVLNKIIRKKMFIKGDK